MTLTRRPTRPVLGAVLALLLVGCGGSDGAARDGAPTPTSSVSLGPAAGGPHNGADVSFAAGMIPHHGQALEMAELALEKTSNPRIRSLATAIHGAQDPEIRTMSGWLAGWGEDVPDPHSAAAMGHGAGHSGMGTMTETQMSGLEEARGAEFDRMFCELMIEHHQGAIDMSNKELAEGRNAEAKALAQDIIDAQSAEIAVMRRILAGLGSSPEPSPRS